MPAVPQEPISLVLTTPLLQFLTSPWETRLLKGNPKDMLPLSGTQSLFIIPLRSEPIHQLRVIIMTGKIA